MERPYVDHYNICNPMRLTAFINDINEYIDILEETITALRDDHAELLQNNKELAKKATSLKEEIQHLIERYSPSTPFKGGY